ncbi:hypothetical protein PHLCEN_2v5270 [Hermanssonia centrifuga]|uniref:Uncharacterized protein n=1 Tax=Hermanssonia centrifuga TaxID=98765 RepID=A0A2R6P8I5_9APHY|nr:hypothetical protein PHLCEN_2v5270 [Hermanssonia centrifuga]
MVRALRASDGRQAAMCGQASAFQGICTPQAAENMPWHIPLSKCGQYLPGEITHRCN